MIGLPQPFVFLLVVINHWLEEVNLRLAGHLVDAVHLPFAQFAADFREHYAEVVPGDAVAQTFIGNVQRGGAGVNQRCFAVVCYCRNW